MDKKIKLAKASALVLLMVAAFQAHAENTETGGGPIDLGEPATVYVGAPNIGSDGGATPPLSQQDLGPSAIVSIGEPNLQFNDGATGDIRVAHDRSLDGSVAAAGRSGATQAEHCGKC